MSTNVRCGVCEMTTIRTMQDIVMLIKSDELMMDIIRTAKTLELPD